jgi:di/tricarboxylate transporter
MSLPSLPAPHALATLAMTFIALALFTREKIPLETSSLLVLSALTVLFELFPFKVDSVTLHAVDFFSGFGHEALVAVCALMIAGQGLIRTGALEPIGHSLARLWDKRPGLSLLLTLVVAAVTSAFVNNVPVVVLLMPILISVSLRTKSSASSKLMPMGFATILGGTTTTIGTSTNLLIVGVAADIGLRRLGMFDFLLPAAFAGGLGILYLWLIASRLIPFRQMPLADTSPRVFTAHLAVLEGGRGEGKKLSEVMQLTGGRMKVKSVERGPSTFVFPLPDVLLRAGDHLVVSDTPDHLKEFEKLLGGALYPEDSEDQPFDEDHPLRADDQQIAEVVVAEGSALVGTTLSSMRFAERYRLITMALHRPGWERDVMYDEVGDVRLRAGDVLLVQGPREQVSNLKRGGQVLVLDATADLPFTRKAPRALVIMIGIIVAAAAGLLPIAISATCGVLFMILTGCLGWRDVTRALSVQVIMIVVTSLALGSALLKTGGAEFLAQVFLSLTHGASPQVVFSALILLMALVTNIVSNNAAAIIGTPIGISIALQLGLNPEPFVLAVLFGANMSFCTPMAYKTNLLIMSAGGYTFLDFLKIGTPLVLIMWLFLSWLLPVIYGVP